MESKNKLENQQRRRRGVEVVKRGEAILTEIQSVRRRDRYKLWKDFGRLQKREMGK